jgi:AcrR family transcriptional regulator
MPRSGEHPVSRLVSGQQGTEDPRVTDSPDWRSRRWAGTHQRIYDTAMELFQEHGFERVSVGQIASGAGVSVPTFYAHYPSKEHIVMQLPTAEDIALIISGQPVNLPVAERIRLAVPLWLGQWSSEDLEAHLARWRVIAATPALRTRAAEFERTTAGMVTDALPTRGGGLKPGDAVVVNAYLSAYTAGVLAWADGNGERKLDEHIAEAFDALEGH